MTTADLAAALLRDVPRLKRHLRGPNFLPEAEVLAALFRALTLPDGEAWRVLERLAVFRTVWGELPSIAPHRETAPGITTGTVIGACADAADLIKALLAQRAADVARIRELEAQNGILRTEKHADAEAIGDLQAKLAEVEKERDEAVQKHLGAERVCDLLDNKRAAAEATVATLTAQVEAMRGAVGSVAEQATFEEWQAEMGCDPKDQGDVSTDWHAGYDAAIRHARKIVAALTTENQTNG